MRKSPASYRSIISAFHSPLSLSVSAISSDVSAPAPSWPERAKRSVLARPRVTSSSSRVTRKEGHIAPPSSLRQAPLLLHISTPRFGVPANEFTTDSTEMTASGRSTTDYWVRYSMGAMLFASGDEGDDFERF